MPPSPPYSTALARVREVLEFHWARPGFLPHSIELQDCTRAAARAAAREVVSLATLAADLGRLAAETLEHDPGAAVEAGRAMARWAAGEYRAVVGWLTDGGP